MAPGPSECNAEMVEVSALMELCQNILDGDGIPAVWAISVTIFIFQGK